MARKTANDVHSDLRVHEKMCEERWKTIYKKTDKDLAYWWSHNYSCILSYADCKNSYVIC